MTFLASPARWLARLASPVAAVSGLALALLAAVVPASPTAHVTERAPGPDSAPVRRVEPGQLLGSLGAAPGGESGRVIGANDLARLLDATKFWRADTRKLELRVHAHRVVLNADNPYVVIDESTVKLPSPVLSFGGELQAPVALIDSLPSDSTINRLAWDPRAGVVVVVPPGGVVGAPRVTVQDGVTRLTIPTDHVEDVAVVARARAHFRLRFAGYFAGELPDSIRVGLLRGLRTLPAVTGSALELELSSDAQSYRLLREPKRVVLEISRVASNSWDSFAPELPPGPRALRVIVLDPGHGGSDPGVVFAGAVEKTLALDLARRLRAEIEHRLHARVVMTRDDDRAVPGQARAEIANRAHADVVLSLHFDGLIQSRAAGASAYVPTADVGSAAGQLGGVGPGAITLLPWRDVAARHAVASRALAEAVLSSFELRGMGPTRLRERLPYPLLGVNAPGMLLECATLTSPADRARLGPAGLDALARAIVDGLEAYQRNL
ncbi:MAG TPA: N-acetylmuramoyl-L-alanine amidase [Candidatus Udaeobacter sp.]|nr:N-acetylmuramoyl-L-alanine amidase [Candidatus Udaeobacter sp.]